MIKAKKHFGQNFLIDMAVLDKLSNAVLACENDLIIEIGPGRGALTSKLLNKNSQVLAYEIDTDMAPYLNKINNGNLTIKYQDILKSNIKEDIKNYKYNNLYIIGNLPYYITTPILEYITKQNIKFVNLTIMVQKEVADRFLARPKTKEYGYFTLYLKHFYEGTKIIDVKKESFDPMPKVLSSVITLNQINKDYLSEEYFTFLKKCFSAKRKTLKNNIGNADFGKIKPILNKYNLTESVRSEELSEDIFIDIYKTLN